MKRLQFPTMLREKWSGAEVQAWLDEHADSEPPPMNNDEGITALLAERDAAVAGLLALLRDDLGAAFAAAHAARDRALCFAPLTLNGEGQYG